jgi:hypothetical protein
VLTETTRCAMSEEVKDSLALCLNCKAPIVLEPESRSVSRGRAKRGPTDEIWACSASAGVPKGHLSDPRRKLCRAADPRWHRPASFGAPDQCSQSIDYDTVQRGSDRHRTALALAGSCFASPSARFGVMSNGIAPRWSKGNDRNAHRQLDSDGTSRRNPATYRADTHRHVDHGSMLHCRQHG